MLKRAQKGFSVVEVLLVIVILVLIGAVGWLTYDKQKSEPQENQANEQDKDVSNETEDSTTDEKSPEYSIDLSGSKKPTRKEVSYSEFVVSSSGGNRIFYNPTDNKFMSSNYPEVNADEVATEVKKYAETSDGTPIYLWENSDADTYTDTYLIDLKNGEVLQISFFYTSYDDGVSRSPDYMTIDEIKVQKVKDLEAIKTFKFL